ncbi:hypothetical protein KKB10_03660 [Patescibacteria group bacterium]|nr:hypothetical protein [Patescibacteria group bacterium]MBU1075128.1 hypothetical protein [Patescibacteria group bacterium]MBU1952547.1 hypothetical protein [Patescibacteria group bacterium]MBU2229633.1 hypothetical protein [Patescibacteria group bacterium]
MDGNDITTLFEEESGRFSPGGEHVQELPLGCHSITTERTLARGCVNDRDAIVAALAEADLPPDELRKIEAELARLEAKPPE